MKLISIIIGTIAIFVIVIVIVAEAVRTSDRDFQPGDCDGRILAPRLPDHIERRFNDR